MKNSGQNKAPDASPPNEGPVAADPQSAVNVQPAWAGFQALTRQLDRDYAETLAAPPHSRAGEPDSAEA